MSYIEWKQWKASIAGMAVVPVALPLDACPEVNNRSGLARSMVQMLTSPTVKMPYGRATTQRNLVPTPSCADSSSPPDDLSWCLFVQDAANRFNTAELALGIQHEPKSSLNVLHDTIQPEGKFGELCYSPPLTKLTGSLAGLPTWASASDGRYLQDEVTASPITVTTITRSEWLRLGGFSPDCITHSFGAFLPTSACDCPCWPCYQPPTPGSPIKTCPYLTAVA